MGGLGGYGLNAGRGLCELAAEMTTCRVCDEPFDKDRMGQIVCGVRCAAKLPVFDRKKEIAEKKAEKRADRAKLKAMEPLSKQAARTQTAFNAFIRARDADKPCVSCGTFKGKMNAGHFLSRGSHPELRFDEANTQKQCEYCNTHKHGNPIPYRAELLIRIGPDELARLEGPAPPKKYTVGQLEDMARDYRKRTKEMTC